MSSRERTLILKIDDTQLKDAIKKMQDVNAGGSSSTSGKQPKGIMGLAKIFTQNSGILKTVAKLTLILAAISIMVKLITKITDRIVDSSPILQTMLKLLQTSITFILRPIGDFIGFFLRPFLIFFLRNIALPTYRLLGPIAKGLGTFLGGNLFSNLTLQYNPEIDPFFGTNGVFSDMGKKFAEWQAQLGLIKFPTFDNVIVNFKAFARKLIEFTITILEKIRPFVPSMENIWKVIGIFAEKLKPIIDSLKPLMIEGLRGLRKVFSLIIPLVGPIIEKVVPVITGMADFVLNLINPLKETFKDIFSVVTGFFNGIKALFDTIADAIRIFFPDFGNNNSGSTTTTTTNNFFGDVTSQEDYNKMFTFEGIIEKSLNSSLSGRG